MFLPIGILPFYTLVKCKVGAHIFDYLNIPIHMQTLLL